MFSQPKIGPLLLKMGQNILNQTTANMIVHMVNICKYMINSIWEEERSVDREYSNLMVSQDYGREGRMTDLKYLSISPSPSIL